jgi:hypothetical protein
MTQEQQALNNSIRDWGVKSVDALKQEFARLNIVHRKDSTTPTASRDSLNAKYKMTGGSIRRIGFAFPRHMVFVHKGVGRETPIGKVGTTNRKAKEWFVPVMDVKVEELADVIAETDADMVVNNFTIR